MKIIAGLETQYQGQVVFAPGYSVGYLPQDPQLDPTKTVKEVVQEGVQHVVDTLKEFEDINLKFGMPEYYEDPEKMDKLFARQAELQDIIDATDAWNLDNRLERAMDALRCPEGDQLTEHLSGGERRRVALCRLLLQKPDVLLLDEPTNHLDAESIDWLEQHLQQYEGTVIAVTHDRYFLDNVAGWILELDRGEGIPWKGNYSSWLEQKTQRLAQEEKTESKRQKTLQRELEWVRMAPKARQAKGKARLNSYDKLLNETVKEKEEKLAALKEKQLEEEERLLKELKLKYEKELLEQEKAIEAKYEKIEEERIFSIVSEEAIKGVEKAAPKADASAGKNAAKKTTARKPAAKKAAAKKPAATKAPSKAAEKKNSEADKK
jgi:ATPase subunit of ABC transporter with duplicated ATPase domains